MSRNLATVIGHTEDPLMAMQSARNHLDPMAVLNLLTMLQNELPTLAWAAGASVRMPLHGWILVYGTSKNAQRVSWF